MLQLASGNVSMLVLLLAGSPPVIMSAAKGKLYEIQTIRNVFEH